MFCRTSKYILWPEKCSMKTLFYFISFHHGQPRTFSVVTITSSPSPAYLHIKSPDSLPLSATVLRVLSFRRFFLDITLAWGFLAHFKFLGYIRPFQFFSGKQNHYGGQHRSGRPTQRTYEEVSRPKKITLLIGSKKWPLWICRRNGGSPADWSPGGGSNAPSRGARGSGKVEVTGGKHRSDGITKTVTLLSGPESVLSVWI